MKKFFKRAVIWAASVAVVSSIIAFSVSTSKVTANVSEVIDLTPQKVAELKRDLVQRLSQCENPKQNAGLITYDNNAKGSLTGQNLPSIGLLQFKISTVKSAYQTFNGSTLTDAEAVTLAMDKEKIFTLAEQIIFSGKDTKGIAHWYNCSNRLGLEVEVKFLKKLLK